MLKILEDPREGVRVWRADCAFAGPHPSELQAGYEADLVLAYLDGINEAAEVIRNPCVLHVNDPL